MGSVERMSAPRWSWAATVVVVMAMTVAVGQAEEDIDGAGPAGGWVNIPVKKSAAKAMKKAVEAASQSKGRWVRVSPGVSAKKAALKISLLDAKMKAAAAKSRKAARKQARMRRSADRAKARIKRIKDAKKAKRAGIAKAEKAMAKMKQKAKAASGNMKEMTKFMKLEEKAKLKQRKLVNKKKAENKKLKSLRRSKQRRDKRKQKAEKVAKRRKATAKADKMKDIMVAAGAGPKGAAKAVRKLMDSVQKDTTKLKEARATASQSAKSMLRVAKHDARAKARLNRLLAKADVDKIEAKITSVKSQLKTTRKQVEKASLKAVNARTTSFEATLRGRVAEKNKVKESEHLKKMMSAAEQKQLKAKSRQTRAMKSKADAEEHLKINRAALKKHDKSLAAARKVLDLEKRRAAAEASAKAKLLKAQASQKLLAKKLHV